MKKLLIGSAIVLSIIFTAGLAWIPQAAAFSFPWTGTGTLYFVDNTGTVTEAPNATITLNQATALSDEPKDFGRSAFFGTLIYTLASTQTTVTFSAIAANTGVFTLNGVTDAAADVTAELYFQNRHDNSSTRHHHGQPALVINGSIPGGTAVSFIGSFTKQ
ncbi:MAG: hypothetical protein ABSE08_19110 [Syntrophobacteraceae bacterium]|jgi:hypothetical protein